MKAKDVFMILMVSTCFWSMIAVVTYYLGEYQGRESVVCHEPHKLYGYIDKHGELVWDEFPEAAYETFYPETIEK